MTTTKYTIERWSNQTGVYLKRAVRKDLSNAKQYASTLHGRIRIVEWSYQGRQLLSFKEVYRKDQP
jgi:hypothetical protein